MVGFIIFSLLLIITMFFIGFSSGKDAVFSSLKSETNEDRNYKIESHEGGVWVYLLFVLSIWVMSAVDFSTTIKDYYIDSYRNHKIVEMVEYQYKTIDGEKILVDSTFCYTRNKFGN